MTSLFIATAVLFTAIASLHEPANAATCLACSACSSCEWGSSPLPNSMRPNCSFTSSFPSVPTVTVSSGGSFVSAQNRCTRQLGKTGWCTIELRGVPMEDTLRITRSFTKVTSRNSVTLTRTGSGAFVRIGSNKHHIAVDGLTISGHRTDELFGIVVEGSKIRFISVTNNHISDFDASLGAHAIAVYGTDNKNTNAENRAMNKPIRHVCIGFNEVSDMQLGYSEGIAMNGFVRRWSVHHNVMTNLNNIAIDAIGGEGTFPPKEVDGRILPNEKDAAMWGFIEDNKVDGMSTVTNPQYGMEHSWAAAIYVDGGRYIYIANNDVKGAPWAYEIGAENCVKTRNVIVENNKAQGGYFGDMVVGGYRRRGFEDDDTIQCNPLASQDHSEGHGYVQQITVLRNEFLTTDGMEDSFGIEYRTTYAIIEQNGVSSERDHACDLATGNENAICIN